VRYAEIALNTIVSERNTKNARFFMYAPPGFLILFWGPIHLEAFVHTWIDLLDLCFNAKI
ncbi:MAG: hypothetical protein KH615_03070, partial [Clostridiales bacterium]|nr:hypothetical protein [Clostridiales bacterium]